MIGICNCQMSSMENKGYSIFVGTNYIDIKDQAPMQCTIGLDTKHW